MTPIFIKKASEILTMTDGIGLIKDSSILIDDGVIRHIGKVDGHTKGESIDARGCVVIPGFVDAHTHLVFAGSREHEFELRNSGIKYEKIAKQGGGIFNTVLETRKTSEDDLFKLGMKRIEKIMQSGTTTVEIKSGYGLSKNEEIKMLRVIKRLKEHAPIDVVSTYLVHAIPPQMKARDYIDVVNEEIIPEVARGKLAAFCDIFCDKTAFTRKQSELVLGRAQEFNMKLKIHADELTNSGGATLAAKLGCTSADHLIFTTRSGIKDMKKAGVIPVLLPGTSLFLKSRKKPKTDLFMKYKTPVAISSDYNPGTCMIYSMPVIMSLACILYGLTAEKAFEAATINSARALGIADRVGSLRPGGQADVVILNTDHFRKVPYQCSEPMVRMVIKKGKIVYGKNS